MLNTKYLVCSTYSGTFSSSFLAPLALTSILSAVLCQICLQPWAQHRGPSPSPILLRCLMYTLLFTDLASDPVTLREESGELRLRRRLFSRGLGPVPMWTLGLGTWASLCECKDSYSESLGRGLSPFPVVRPAQHLAAVPCGDSIQLCFCFSS